MFGILKIAFPASRLLDRDSPFDDYLMQVYFSAQWSIKTGQNRSFLNLDLNNRPHPHCLNDISDPIISPYGIDQILF